ncbi:ABC transporter substrate-binding protein [Oribacterium sp.]
MDEKNRQGDTEAKEMDERNHQGSTEAKEMDERNSQGGSEAKESKERVKQAPHTGAEQHKGHEYYEDVEDSEEEAALERERQRLREERRARRKQKEAAQKAAQKAAQRRRLFLLLFFLCVVFMALFLFLRKGRPAQRGEEKTSSSVAERAPIEVYYVEDKGSTKGEELGTYLENAGENNASVNLHTLIYEEGKEEDLKQELKEAKAELLLGEGSEKLEAFLEKFSVEEKIPYLSQSSKKLEPGNNHFVLEKSLEDQAVDLGFFAYNEAFRKMGILLHNGDEKGKTLAEQLSESFPEYGGTVEIRTYQGEEDFQAKLSELEEAGIDLLFLPSPGEQEKALLSQEKAYNVLLGKDWDQENFPADLELPYPVYLYGRENKAFPLVEKEEESSDSSGEEAQKSSDLSGKEAQESSNSSGEEAQSGSRYDRDLLGILSKLRTEAKKKSLLQTLESMSYQGECGEYHFLPGQYCLKGQGQFYEFQGQEKRDLNP